MEKVCDSTPAKKGFEKVECSPKLCLKSFTAVNRYMFVQLRERRETNKEPNITINLPGTQGRIMDEQISTVLFKIVAIVINASPSYGGDYYFESWH